MPHAIIKLWTGRTEEQKNLLAEKITETIMKTINASEKSISIDIVEIDEKDWETEVYSKEIRGKKLYKEPGY